MEAIQNKTKSIILTGSNFKNPENRIKEIYQRIRKQPLIDIVKFSYWCGYYDAKNPGDEKKQISLG